MKTLVTDLHDRYWRFRRNAFDAAPDELIQHEVANHQQARPRKAPDQIAQSRITPAAHSRQLTGA
jgi:hypothetical protein